MGRLPLRYILNAKYCMGDGMGLGWDGEFLCHHSRCPIRISISGYGFLHGWVEMKDLGALAGLGPSMPSLIRALGPLTCTCARIRTPLIYFLNIDLDV